MRGVVVYESMFGNTRELAEAIARGMAPGIDAVPVPVSEASAEVLHGIDLLVVGGPTHAHGMSSSATRVGAPQYVEKSHGDLHLEPDFEGPGLRDWFQDMPEHPVAAAAFDTRADIAAVLSGRASKGIASRLKKHGCELVVPPESFLVDKSHHLLPGELDRALAWGATLATYVGTQV
jgi:hypothetical protein